MDHDHLEGIRDSESYDLVDAGYDEDRAVIEEWARAVRGPLLDVARGFGRQAIPMAIQRAVRRAIR